MFDLQQKLEALEPGVFKRTEHLEPIGDNEPTLSLEMIEDVKTVLVKNRADQVSGIGIPLNAIPMLRSGDRLMITGRVPPGVPAGSWGVALVMQETELRKAEECQLAMFTSPRSLFTLTHILSSTDLNELMIVQTTRWGAIKPTMDLYIDSIIIFRDEKYSSIVEDLRTIVYSLETDSEYTTGEILAVGEEMREIRDYSGMGFLVQAGSPEIRVFRHNEAKALYISNRNKDWDGVDLNMQHMKLYPGNKYQITVTGSVDGLAPKGMSVTLQGIPGYTWRSNQVVESDGQFILRHTLSQSEADHWATIRITTDAVGAHVPFYIYGIEVKRLGFL